MIDSNIYFIVALIGAGQLGSRYLQGLATCEVPLEIFVVDPNEKSLKTAQLRWEEVANGNALHRVHFSQALEGLPAEVDLSLVTTTADVRLQVVEQVQSQCKVRYWILEKVLAQSEDQINRLEQLLLNAEGVWVNTPRRAYSWHQQIYEQLPRGRAWQVTGSGGAWGMACNSIHFIDLVAWWTGEELGSVDTSGLEKWFPSKRSGFWEVSGKLKMVYSRGSQLELSADESNTPFSLNLHNKHGRWQLDESVGSFTNSNGFSLLGKVEFQSELTGPLVDQILKTGQCSLPALAESAKMHRPLITALLDHWNASHQSNDTFLPIT
jgi:hypothetical protein